MQQAYYNYLLSLLDESVSNDEDNGSAIYLKRTCSPQTLRVFITYLFTRMNCSLEVYVLSLLYIERLHSNCPSILTYDSVVGIVLASVIVAHKYHEETSYFASFYAQLANISIFQLNRLEVDFISRIDFSLYVSSSAYYNFYIHLCSCATCPNAPFPNVCLPSLLIVPTSSDSLLLYANDQQELQRRDRFHSYQLSAIPKILPIPVPIQPVAFPSYFPDQGSKATILDSSESISLREINPPFCSLPDSHAKYDYGRSMRGMNHHGLLPAQHHVHYTYGYCVPLSVQLVAPVFLVRPPLVCGRAALEDGCARRVCSQSTLYYSHPLFSYA